MGLHGIVLGFLGDLRNDKGFFFTRKKNGIFTEKYISQ